MWLLGAKRTKGLAAKQSSHTHLSEKSSSFIQVGVAALFCSQALSFFGSKEPHIRAFKWHIIFVWIPTASTEIWSKSSKKQAWKYACTRTFVYKCISKIWIYILGFGSILIFGLSPALLWTSDTFNPDQKRFFLSYEKRNGKIFSLSKYEKFHL